MARKKREFPENGFINSKVKNQEVCVQVRTITILENNTLEKVTEELLKLGLQEYWKKNKR